MMTVTSPCLSLTTCRLQCLSASFHALMLYLALDLHVTSFCCTSCCTACFILLCFIFLQQTNCAGLEASLVSVHSPQEYFFLYQQTTVNGFSPTWLGGFYLEVTQFNSRLSVGYFCAILLICRV